MQVIRVRPFSLTSLLSSVCAMGAVLSCAGPAATAQTWSMGDVFAGVGNGQYNRYSNSGVFKDTITDSYSNGYTTGCAFNGDLSKLYTTNFSNDGVVIFDGDGSTHTILNTVDTSSAGESNESVVLDGSGNYYVGHADGARGILKLNASDKPVTVYYPDTENRGTDWTDLAADEKTFFYTSEGAHLKRFDSSTNSQLPDFSVALPATYSYAHRMLPPYDGTNGALVADTSEIVRLDKNGKGANLHSSRSRGLVLAKSGSERDIILGRRSWYKSFVPLQHCIRVR